MTKYNELKRDRRIYKALRTHMSQLEKMWLLDCGGDYRRYIKRLHHLASEYGIPISEPESNQGQS
jgi:hypothetical protein